MKISYAGFDAELAGEGALWIAELKLLAVADLHFEKGSFFKAFSTFLPPYDSALTLQRLGNVISRYVPDILVAAGDSFHDRGAVERMNPKDRATLDALIGLVPEWRWIVGNHDPEGSVLLGGVVSEDYYMGGIAFRHRTEGSEATEVSGHYHPKATVRVRGHRIRAPCFLRAGGRMILPSFGHYTGGLDIDHEVLSNVANPHEREVYILHEETVFRV